MVVTVGSVAHSVVVGTGGRSRRRTMHKYGEDYKIEKAIYCEIDIQENSSLSTAAAPAVLLGYRNQGKVSWRAGSLTGLLAERRFVGAWLELLTEALACANFARVISH